MLNHKCIYLRLLAPILLVLSFCDLSVAAADTGVEQKLAWMDCTSALGTFNVDFLETPSKVLKKDDAAPNLDYQNPVLTGIQVSQSGGVTTYSSQDGSFQVTSSDGATASGTIQAGGPVTLTCSFLNVSPFDFYNERLMEDGCTDNANDWDLLVQLPYSFNYGLADHFGNSILGCAISNNYKDILSRLFSSAHTGLTISADQLIQIAAATQDLNLFSNAARSSGEGASATISTQINAAVSAGQTIAECLVSTVDVSVLPAWLKAWTDVHPDTDINAKDANGDTIVTLLASSPLFLADNALKKLKILSSQFPNLNMSSPNKTGQSPIALAANQNDQNMVTFLRANGQQLPPTLLSTCAEGVQAFTSMLTQSVITYSYVPDSSSSFYSCFDKWSDADVDVAVKAILGRSDFDMAVFEELLSSLNTVSRQIRTDTLTTVLSSNSLVTKNLGDSFFVSFAGRSLLNTYWNTFQTMMGLRSTLLNSQYESGYVCNASLAFADWLPKLSNYYSSQNLIASLDSCPSYAGSWSLGTLKVWLNYLASTPGRLPADFDAYLGSAFFPNNLFWELTLAAAASPSLQVDLVQKLNLLAMSSSTGVWGNSRIRTTQYIDIIEGWNGNTSTMSSQLKSQVLGFFLSQYASEGSPNTFEGLLVNVPQNGLDQLNQDLAASGAKATWCPDMGGEAILNKLATAIQSPLSCAQSGHN